MGSPVGAALPDPDDPRTGLDPDEQAASGMELVATVPKSITGTGSDMAFQGDLLALGGYNGFTLLDISTPAAPTVLSTTTCPGSQGDVSIVGDLLLVSVEATSARVDCLTGGVNAENRMRGLRVFDISDPPAPEQVATVQTCRGSHTHTVVPDEDTVIVYSSSVAGVRAAAEPPGCSSGTASDPTASRWSIDVIEVPLDDPAAAALLDSPRIFADPVTGAIDGLQNAPQTPQHPSGSGWSPSPVTNGCADIAVSPSQGLAAAACGGNGLLLDISDPAHPTRIDAVAHPSVSYWDSVMWTHDGTQVVFGDLWGVGSQARCRSTDDLEWAASRVYDVVDDSLEARGHYKLPAAQDSRENCAPTLGSHIPVPGRSLVVQAWFQGGVSVWDLTDADAPHEIAYFDRGPASASTLVAAGHWAAYYYDGHVYAHDLARGLDVLRLVPGDDLSAAEAEAAEAASYGHLNPQTHEVVTPGALITEHPQDATAASGDAVGFSAAAIGSTSVRWERRPPGATDWEPIDGATTATLALTAQVSLDGSAYRAVFANGSGHDTFSEPAVLTVEAAETTTGVEVTPASSTVGDDLTVTATVAPATATGTVRLSVDGDEVGTPLPIVDGAATGPLPVTLAAGSHEVAAAYSGDADHSPSSGSTTVTVWSTDEALVRRAYQEVLGRAGDAAGIAHWVARLESGTSATTFIAQLSATPEARSRVVTRAYQLALLRNPEAAALTYWSEQLRTATSAEALLATLLGSDEALTGSGDTTSLAGRLYTAILERPGDAAGIAYWTDRLADAPTPSARAHVATQFGRAVEVTGVVTRSSAARVCGTTAGSEALVDTHLAYRHHRPRLDGTALVLLCRPGGGTGSSQPTG